MNNEEWDEFYLLAAKETDRKKMPGRIAAVRGQSVEGCKN